MVHDRSDLVVLFFPRQLGICHNVINLSPRQIEHVGLDLLGEIIICAFGEEILAFHEKKPLKKRFLYILNP